MPANAVKESYKLAGILLSFKTLLFAIVLQQDALYHYIEKAKKKKQCFFFAERIFHQISIHPSLWLRSCSIQYEF